MNSCATLECMAAVKMHSHSFVLLLTNQKKMIAQGLLKMLIGY